MIKYENKMEVSYVQVSCECDKCKKNYMFDDSNDMMEIQEFVSFEDVGGYASIVGDEQRYSINLCQHCAMEILLEFYQYHNFDNY